MKQYLVQIMEEDGAVAVAIKSANQILEMYGHRDCSGEDYKVYDVSEFGEVRELEYKPSMDGPCNYHTFVYFDTDEVAFSGFSTEH